MPVEISPDPLPAFRFRVEKGRKILSQVTEVSGLALDTRVPTLPQPERKDGDHPACPGVVLKRGVTQNTEFWDWFTETQKNPTHRQNLRIVIMDAEGRDAISWTLVNAYPVRWSGPELRADISAVAFESLELYYDRITRHSAGRHQTELSALPSNAGTS
ncbi:MAG: phage tail protein [Methanoregula sp.]|jgi:phage tail-like protein|uniref:phage tail protein n=1 Tax=Methanoregula sp. TaxID=2052170 RepID=UPI003C2A9B69